jgi:hypothetical protein
MSRFSIVILIREAKDLLPQQWFRTAAIVLRQMDRIGIVPSEPPLS